MYVAIVGALTPSGQFIAKSLKNSETVKILFTVDEGYEATKPIVGQYRTIDEALRVPHVTSFCIIDVLNDEKTAERAKIYRFYGVSAIVCGLMLNSEDLVSLEKGYSVRHRTFASVLIEPDLLKFSPEDMLAAVRRLLRWLTLNRNSAAFDKQVYYKVFHTISTGHGIVPV